MRIFDDKPSKSWLKKIFKDWSRLSIAPTPDRIRLVEATNDDKEECRTTIAPETPLKKTHKCWLFWTFDSFMFNLHSELSPDSESCLDQKLWWFEIFSFFENKKKLKFARSTLGTKGYSKVIRDGAQPPKVL